MKLMVDFIRHQAVSINVSKINFLESLPDHLKTEPHF